MTTLKCNIWGWITLRAIGTVWFFPQFTHTHIYIHIHSRREIQEEENNK